MSKIIRVLQVLDFLNYNSGVSAVVMNYVTHMRHSNIQCDFLLYEYPNEDFDSTLKTLGAEVYTVCQPTGRNILKYRNQVKLFFEKYGNNYDIIHIHVPNNAFIVLYFARKFGVSVRILHAHNARGADGILKKIRNYILNKWGILHASHYFACSKKAGEYLYGKRKMQQVQVLYNAIDLERFAYKDDWRYEIRKQLGLGDELLLGHVGRFVGQKNHAFLLDLVKELLQDGTQCKLILLGDGPLLNEIKQKAMELEITEAIIFVGVVDNVEQYLSAMDVFLLPSLYEGLPVVCVEAQASGLPCIISNEITKEVQLTDYVTFLDIENITIWKDEIVRISNEERHNAKIEQLDKYNIEIQAGKLEEMYLEYGMDSNTDVHI